MKRIEKQKKLLERLLHTLSRHTYKGNVWIKRVDLRREIQNVLSIIDAHTVNNWINWLLGIHAIRPNPHTEKTSKKELTKPSNDTIYIINIELVKFLLKEKYSNSHPTLFSFKPFGGGSKGKSRNSLPQDPHTQ